MALSFYVKDENAEVCDHDWQIDQVIPATCTEAGETDYICSKCNAEKEEPIAALGHLDDNKDGKCDRCGTDLGGTTPASGEYVPATEFAAGDKIVIVATHGGKLYAMSNAIENSVAPAVEVTATENALDSVTDSIVWTLGAADGGFTLSANGSQLQVSKGNLSLVAEGGVFSVTGTGVSCTATTDRSLFTQLYNGSYRFKNYAVSNLGNANYASAVTVYKLVAE